MTSLFGVVLTVYDGEAMNIWCTDGHARAQFESISDALDFAAGCHDRNPKGTYVVRAVSPPSSGESK